MKISYFIFPVFLLAACADSSKDKKEGADSISDYKAPVVDTGLVEACFLRTEGIQDEDTLFVQLVINNGKVSGKFNTIPFQKDARRGTISGTRTGNDIKGTWIYMQEGMRDSLPVEFRFTGERIYQKKYVIDKSTGREYLDESAESELRYNRVDCK